ncbi:formate nitrite transporter [Chlorella sorokiniana]|uniref:Formate nitrite transporter n=1 Tax=Chlorella sorokiniana TaxID=3076 RepID=A0A2P6TJI2_CHLSO|nr:formate nitrite transporter [Chlorella sorokiniana]|eukprot:PRW39389.1 formate nitrite transporter [Chlorella sorokiniana]
MQVDLSAVQPEHPPAGVSPFPAALKQRADAPSEVPALVAAAAAARAQPELTHVSAVLTPAQVYQAAVDAGCSKDRAPLPKLFLMGIASGTFIGLGFTTCALVGGNLSSDAIGFPLGLILIVFCGGDLFTGNCFYSLVAWLEGRISLLGACRLLMVAWCSNLVGCLLMVGLFDGARVWPGRDHYLTHLAEAKCSLGWGTVVVRGIIANMLVCLAAWLANAARDASGKILGIYMPIMSFTAIGLEHCIANMFIVPMGIVQGADVTIGKWIYSNLIPATIGNWIGGTFMVGLLNAGIYGTVGAKAWATWERGVAAVERKLGGCGGATYYGLDGWSIHKGACGLGYQYKNQGTGWDVAAIADASPEFAGSCGRCYEVKCDPRSVVTDGYGNSFDRSGVCKHPGATVVVRTVDNCPCNYPGNAYSNKRWCCGDNSGTQGTHFDMSIWAFEKLADVAQGVAAIQFRRVPCSYTPSNPAPDGPTGMPPSEQPSALGYGGDAYNPPSNFASQPMVMRFDDSGEKQGALRPAGDWDTKSGTPTISLGDVLETGASASTSSSSSSSSGSSCTDTPPSGSTCEQQKSNGQCGQPWMLSGNYCRATCGFCKPNGSSSSSSSSSGSSSSSASSSSSGSSSCTDTAPSDGKGCWQHKQWGNCNQGWMTSGNYCASTCGRCSQQSGSSDGSSSSSSTSDSSSTNSGSSVCSDTAPPGQAGCWQQKQWGKCNDGWLVAGNYCASTCGRCGGNSNGQQQQSGGSSSSSSSSSSASSSSSSGCTNKAPSDGKGCWQHKQWGNCNRGWMTAGNYCASTCGRCGGSNSGSNGSNDGQQQQVQAFSSSSSSSSSSWSGRRLRLK